MGLGDDIGELEGEGEVKSGATGSGGGGKRSCKGGGVNGRVVSLCTTISCTNVDWGMETSVGVARGGAPGEGGQGSVSAGEGDKSNELEGIGADEGPGWADG